MLHRKLIAAAVLLLALSGGGCFWHSGMKLSKAELPAAEQGIAPNAAAAIPKEIIKPSVLAAASEAKAGGSNVKAGGSDVKAGARSEQDRPATDFHLVNENDEDANSWVDGMKTLGGRQFWADQLFFNDWKIQRNVFTGHCRLLDGNDHRHKSGSYDQCAAALDEIKIQRKLPPMQGKCVILLHGLCRSSNAMNKMAAYLKKEGGYTVFNVEYPSSQAEIESHARGLDNIVRHLDGMTEINFVAHSLGNVVIRRYLFDQTDATTGRTPDPRIHRIVMAGAPNNGAKLATTLGRMILFKLIAGSPGQELGSGFEQLHSRLATPQCEFGIIAGGRGDDQGFNPILPGDDDLVVSVAETRLPGAHDFILLPVVHTFMADAPQVQQCTLRFLQHGYFVAEDKRQPIAAEELPLVGAGK